MTQEARQQKHADAIAFLIAEGHAPSAETIARCTSVCETCQVDECEICSVRECPYQDPLHFHHDGCPSCYDAEDDED